MNISSILLRSVSGLVYMALIIGCILMGFNTIVILAILLAVLASIELTKICHELNSRTLPTLLLDIAGCIALCCGIYVVPLAIWIFIILARFIEELYIKVENPIKNLSLSMLIQIYIGIPLGLMVATSQLTPSPNILLAIFFFIWINDTGAFLVGSTLGRHRLFERISPKKSWEGFFGGLFFNIVAAVLFNFYCSGFFGFNGLAAWCGLALIVTVFATWGDLCESLIKRTLQIKDSGHLIPGHGGILDRIDSLLFVMPAAFIYLLLLSLEKLTYIW